MASRHGSVNMLDGEKKKFTRQGQVRTTGHAVPRVVNTFDVSGNLTRSDEYLGNREINNIQFIADVSGSLNSTYWTFSSAADATAYYIWYNVNAAGVDPSPGGTGIEVALSTNDTAIAVKEGTITAIDSAAISDDARIKSIGTSRAELSNQEYGTCTAPIDIDSGSVFEQVDEGSDWTLVTSTLISYDVDNNPTEIIRLEH